MTYDEFTTDVRAGRVGFETLFNLLSDHGYGAGVDLLREDKQVLLILDDMQGGVHRALVPMKLVTCDLAAIDGHTYGADIHDELDPRAIAIREIYYNLGLAEAINREPYWHRFLDPKPPYRVDAVVSIGWCSPV